MASSSDGTTASSGMEVGLAATSRSSHGSTSTSSTTRSSQLQSPFVVNIILHTNLPTLILESIANCLDSMDVLYLSRTCQILQHKLQQEWGGWPCDNCQQPLFAGFASVATAAASTRLMDMDITSSDINDDSGNNTEDAATVVEDTIMEEGGDDDDSPSGGGGGRSDDKNNMNHHTSKSASSAASASSSSRDHQQHHQVSSRTSSSSSSDNPTSTPPVVQQQQQQQQQQQPTTSSSSHTNDDDDDIKVGGCSLCKRRTCPDCTERCIECGMTACEEFHQSFDGEMCINAVCTDDFVVTDGDDAINHLPPRHSCRGCLNKCRSCEDAYCGTCSSISLCRYCGNSECPYCQDQCFDEAYGYERNTI